MFRTLRTLRASAGLAVALAGCEIQEPAPVAAAPAPPAPSADPIVDAVEQAYEGQTPPENVRMLLAIARGEAIGPGKGWFGPGLCSYSWEWLAEKYASSPEAAIPVGEIPGKPEWLAALDVNDDGTLTREDLNWSAAGKAGPLPGLPPRNAMLKLFFAGELGPLNEGPGVGDVAPDFTLLKAGETESLRLGDLLGEKPVVLVFGSLTCGVFRSRFEEIEAIRGRFADDAEFLFVYVREAHPEDGWVTDDNASAGISVKQPETYPARVATANRCRTKLRPSMPVVVDEIGDPVALAYAAPPARLYVLDRTGVVTFRGGRGPASFDPRQMEQALSLTLLQQAGR